MIAEFPQPYEFLFEPHRYKGIRGGRAAGRSWNVARALLILGGKRPLRILCARETQKSIADSVHTLLRDQIKALGLEGFYTVTENSIRGKNGTEFIFAGLKHNINNIKSVEGCDIVWVEEAQNVSKNSWDTLIPTIRKQGSEIWLTWNDAFETDDTHIRFVVNKPPGAVVKKLTFRDNPWFPETLRVEMEHLKATDFQAYLHVWEGECKSAVEGAVYGAEIKQAETEGRICSVPRDLTKPVETIWDLGYGDKTAIWFVQYYGGWYNFIDYLEDAGRTIDWYIVQLQQKAYRYGTHWLPHDALDTIIHGKLSAGRERSIESIMRETYRDSVRLVEKKLVVNTINAGRMLFPQARFDKDACYEGLRALRMYQWGPPSQQGIAKREPLHDAASHGASAFGYAGVVLKQPEPEEPIIETPRRIQSRDAWMLG